MNTQLKQISTPVINGFKVLAFNHKGWDKLVIVGRTMAKQVVFVDHVKYGSVSFLPTITSEDRDRDNFIKRVRRALKLRTGKTWSVTGSTGTSWGWVTINVPPSRRKFERDGVTPKTNEYGYMSASERKELTQLMGLENAHHQGISIPAQSDYREEYIDRAEGRKPRRYGSPDWD